MQIFMSHASHNKPLLRELRNKLPRHFDLWIDEDRLMWGGDLDVSLRNAIQDGTDYVVLFADREALESPWVRQEIQVALRMERESGRRILLPVMLTRTPWPEEFEADLKGRKYLSLQNYSEQGISALAESLSNELFALISQDFEATNAKLAQLQKKVAELESAPRQEPAAPEPTEAEKYTRFLQQAAATIRKHLLPHRVENPLEFEQLWHKMTQEGAASGMSQHDLADLILQLQRNAFLAGVYFDGDEIYIEASVPIDWKMESFVDVKKRIARKAAREIRSGMVVTLDGGSTTSTIAQRLARSLVSRTLSGITVITNSIPAATILIAAANEIAAADSQSTVRVLLGGGRIRPSQLTVVPYPADARSSIEDLVASVGTVDISIVGTTGVTKQGFTTGTREEATSKTALLTPGNRRIVVTDPSKFGLRQAYCFAELDGVEVMTVADGHETVVDEYRVILESAGATLTLA